MAESYTIGVRSRWPWFGRYKSVIGHKNETIDGQTRLVLRFKDNSILAIPQIGAKHVKIYPDYIEFMTPKAEPVKAVEEEISDGGTRI